MSVSVTIKNFVTQKIGALSSVEAVYGYETLQFSGYPAVTVSLPTLDGSFASTAENERAFAFSINVFFPLGKDMENPVTMPREQYAENVIGTVIDDIIDAFDTDFSATALGLPTTYTAKYVEAADNRPFYVELENGLHRGTEITLRFVTERTVQ